MLFIEHLFFKHTKIFHIFSFFFKDVTFEWSDWLTDWLPNQPSQTTNQPVNGYLRHQSQNWLTTPCRLPTTVADVGVWTSV